MNRFTRWALAVALVAGVLLVGAPAQASSAGPAMILDAPAPAAAVVAANYTTTNYVVDPASPGPGVYCIQYYPWPPPAGWDPATKWRYFVPRGYWASQIGDYPFRCTIGSGDTADGDGFWIDPNHRVDVYKWAVSSGYPYTGDWYYQQTVRGNQSLMFTSSGNYLLKVQNGA